MDKDTTKSTFTEYLKGLDLTILLRQVDRLQLDRYTKKLLTSKFLKLMIYAQTQQVPSLTDISQHLRENPDLQQEVGLSSISTSQLSRRLGSMDPDCCSELFAHHASDICSSGRPKQAREKARKLCIVDAYTVTMCLSQFRWAEFRSTKAGIKIHQRLVFTDGIAVPDKGILTCARPSDRSQMDHLVESSPTVMYTGSAGVVQVEMASQR